VDFQREPDILSSASSSPLKRAVTRAAAKRGPLLMLLDSISSFSRSQIRHVRLSTALGYRCQLNFGTAELLYRWLNAGNAQSAWSPDSLRDRGYTSPISLTLLLGHATSYPKQIVLRDGTRIDTALQCLGQIR